MRQQQVSPSSYFHVHKKQQQTSEKLTTSSFVLEKIAKEKPRL